MSAAGTTQMRGTLGFVVTPAKLPAGKASQSCPRGLRSRSAAGLGIFSTRRPTTNPGALLPGLFFEALSSIRRFPDFPNPFFTPIRMAGISWCKRVNHALLGLLRPDWSQADRLSTTLRHELIALCLYCITGDGPSQGILTDRSRTEFVHLQKTG